jgi:hypothetical protein
VGDTLDLDKVATFVVLDVQKYIEIEVGHAVLGVVANFDWKDFSGLERDLFVWSYGKVAFLELVWVAWGKSESDRLLALINKLDCLGNVTAD